MSAAVTILSTKKLKEQVLDTATDAGIQIRDINFIKITEIVNPEKAKAIAQCREHVVFTSANAVKGYLANMTQSGSEINGRHVFCLTGETLKTVMRLPHVETIVAAKDAASLARLIVQQKGIEQVSFICGNKRRNELPDLLQNHKIAVEEIQVYTTIIHPKPVTEEYDAVLFFSPSSAEAFFQTNILRKAIPCFCIGHTTADEVKQFTNNRVIVAEQASQESMLVSLKTYFKKQLKTKKYAGSSRENKTDQKESAFAK
jgi:uroporphyrinogen-III synthase